MKIILEGPNGSGKSTLSRTLSKEFEIDVTHAGPAPNRFEAIEGCTEQCISDHCILDRITPLSCQCYEQPYIIDEGVKRAIDKAIGIHEKTAVIVYLNGDGGLTRKPYYTDKHWVEVQERSPVIWEKYDNLMDTVKCLRYDFRTDSVEELILKIRETFDKLKDKYESR